MEYRRQRPRFHYLLSSRVFISLGFVFVVLSLVLFLFSKETSIYADELPYPMEPEKVLSLHAEGKLRPTDFANPGKRTVKLGTATSLMKISGGVNQKNSGGAKVCLLQPVMGMHHDKAMTMLQSPFFSTFLPSFITSLDLAKERNSYEVFVGVHEDDEIFNDENRLAEVYTYATEITKGHPVSLHFKVIGGEMDTLAKAYNTLAREALATADCEYFYATADDLRFETSGWADEFIRVLERHGNFGAAAPMDRGSDYGCATFSFVHRTHLLLFNMTYFPLTLRDKSISHWLFHTYVNAKSMYCVSTQEVRRMTKYRQRYAVDEPMWEVELKHAVGRAIPYVKRWKRSFVVENG